MGNIDRVTQLIEMMAGENNFTFSALVDLVPVDDLPTKRLRCSVTLDLDEFDSFTMEPNVKVMVQSSGFGAALNLAEKLGADFTVCFSTPARPVKFNFQFDGFVCEFLFTSMIVFLLSFFLFPLSIIVHR